MKKIISLIFSLIFVLSTSFQLFAQQRFPEDTGVQWIGDWPLGGAVHDVFVQDGRLFSSSRSGVIEWDTHSENLTAINSFPVRGDRWPGTYSSETYSYNEYIYPTTNLQFTLYQINNNISEPIFSFPYYATNVLHIPEYDELIVFGRSQGMTWQQWDISDPTNPVVLNAIADIEDRFAFYNDSLFVLGSYRTDNIKLFQRDEENIWNIVSEINHDDPIAYFLHADTLLTISWQFHTEPVNLSNDIQLQRYLLTDLSEPFALDPIVLEDLISPEEGVRISQAQFLEVDDTHLIIATYEGYLSIIENYFSDAPIVIDSFLIDRYGNSNFDEIRAAENPYRLQEPLRRISRIGNELFLPSGRGITTVNINDLEDLYVDSSRSVEVGGYIQSGYNFGNILVTMKEIYFFDELHAKVDVYSWNGVSWENICTKLFQHDNLANFLMIAANEEHLFYTNQDNYCLEITNISNPENSFQYQFQGYNWAGIVDLFRTSNENDYINLLESLGNMNYRQTLFKVDYENHDLVLIDGLEAEPTILTKYKFKNDHIYTIEDDVLRAYFLCDTLDFSQPIDTLEISGSIKAVNENYAWIQVDENTHSLVSIADPYNLELVNTFNASPFKYSKTSVCETGFYLSGYTDSSYYDMIYDITYTYDPQLVGIIGKSSDRIVHSFSLGDTLWVLDNCTLTGYKMDYEIGVEESSIEEIPSEHVLHPCRPNPFNPSTAITLEVPELTDVKLIVYNTLGQQITTLANNKLTAGKHKFTWNGKNSSGQDVASGIYFVQMQTPSSTLSQKMILMR